MLSVDRNMKLNLGGPRILVGSQKLVNEVCDQDRFMKIPTKVLQEIRALTGDGLFTAFIEEKNWGIAHRLLIPAFGPLGLRKMFDSKNNYRSLFMMELI